MTKDREFVWAEHSDRIVTVHGATVSMDDDCPCIIRADGSGVTRFATFPDTGHVKCPETGAVTRWPFHAMRPGDVAVMNPQSDVGSGGSGAVEQRAAHSYARSRGWKIATCITLIQPNFEPIVTVRRVS